MDCGAPTSAPRAMTSSDRDASWARCVCHLHELLTTPAQQSSIHAFFSSIHVPKDMDNMQESQAGPSRRPASAMDPGNDGNAVSRKVRNHVWNELTEEQKPKTTRPSTGQPGPSERRASAQDGKASVLKKSKTTRPTIGPSGPSTRSASAQDGNAPVLKMEEQKTKTTRPPTSQAKGKKRVLTDSLNSPGKAVELEGGALELRKEQNPKKKKRESDEQRKRRNWNAREARAKPGSTYQRRMTKQRDELRTSATRNTDIAAVLSNIFWAYAARFETIRKDVDASTDSTMVVKSVVKNSREYNQIAPISDDSAVWAHLQPAIDLLADCATNPFQIDIDYWVNEGVLVEADDAINNCVAEFYLRIIRFPNKTALCDAILKYITTFPADLSVAILWLAILGHPADNIKSAVRSSLASRGYVLAADELVGLLSQDNLETLNLGIKHDTPVHLPYAGFTIAGGPKARLDADQLDDCRRFPNFLSIITGPGRSITTYRFACLDYPAPNRLSYRTDPIIGQIEATCIDALCTATLNSRRGGIPDSEYLPTAEIVAVVSKTLELCAPILFTEEDGQMSQSLRGLHDDESTALQRSIPKKDFKAISPVAFEGMKHVSADVVRKVNGAVPSVDLFKDITAEEHSGQTGGTYADNAGEALRLHRHILTLLNDQIPAFGTLTDTVIAQHIGPFIDFWRLLVTKGFIHWSAAFLSRYLCVLQPLVIIAFSNPVNRMLRGGSLADVWSKCKDNDTQDSFLRGQSPANLSEFCRDDEETTLPKYEGK
ncbi:hypothetical protein BD410DRAFT_894776 [Rickenella mellea]|uniref:Uncharacterized protein n=1 Tax=Rickenella mellea TaxID=50990 RepID=A0A4Y7QHU1_9AGAM|nr:hypothetical protein BD410DRAFT_894776 [Rickenella mellea]